MDMARVRVASCIVCYLELTTDELVDVAFGTNYAEDFDFSIDLHSIDVDDVAPPKTKLDDAQCHASLLSSFCII